MQSPEYRVETGKPKKESVFDRPGPLFPGFQRSKPPNFNQIMRTNRREMISLGGIAGLVLIVGIVKAFCSPSKRK